MLIPNDLILEKSCCQMQMVVTSVVYKEKAFQLVDSLRKKLGLHK